MAVCVANNRLNEMTMRTSDREDYISSGVYSGTRVVGPKRTIIRSSQVKRTDGTT